MTITEMHEKVACYKRHISPDDRKIATESKCECGRSMTYRGWKLFGHYAAFRVCEACDIAEEF